jgi:putative tricarboxylic transport membrane protein
MRTASFPRTAWPVVWLALVAGSGLSVHAQSPYDQLRIVAPAAPGGGWDQTARVMQVALQQAGLARTVSVENIPGAAGTIGLARFIGAERGNGDAIMVSGLIMLGGIVSNRSPVTFRDVVPIARLTGEYEVIVVPASSPFRSLADLIRALQARPESISWGGGSAGGSDQMLAGLVAEAVGVPPRRINYIAFSGGGESLSAIVGGQVSVGINGLAELAAQIDSGSVRVLGISSAERLPGLDAPTLREQAVDVVFENWRSVVAPPGIAPADRQGLERAIERMVRSTAWHDALDRYRWLDRYLGGEAFARFVDDEEARVRRVLRQLESPREGGGVLSSVGAYPLFVIAGLGICGVGAIAVRLKTVLIKSQIPNPKSQTAETGLAWPAVAWLGAGVVLHLALAERGGFVVASAALFWCTARAFDARHPARDAVCALGVSVAAYLVFARALDLQLPAGVLAGWL